MIEQKGQNEEGRRIKAILEENKRALSRTIIPHRQSSTRLLHRLWKK